MTDPIVNILLATYQGEEYLRAQLDSLVAQTYPHWHLYISDDGSTDHTLKIIEEFSQNCINSVTVFRGPCNGATHNFLSLISKIRNNRENDLYAFCDQDDIWLPDKLAVALKNYKKQNLKTMQPYLYCSATNVVDASLNFKTLSQLPTRLPSFGNALVQNIASGNTMVFNAALLNLMRRISAENVVIHDWLAYQLATGCDGVVHYDTTPTLLYRQHGSNVIGSNSGLTARLKRLQGLRDGEIKNWANQTQASIESIHEYLNLNAMEQFHKFKEMRSAPSALVRLVQYYKSDIKRHTLAGQLSLIYALIFKLI